MAEPHPLTAPGRTTCIEQHRVAIWINFVIYFGRRRLNNRRFQFRSNLLHPVLPISQSGVVKHVDELTIQENSITAGISEHVFDLWWREPPIDRHRNDTADKSSPAQFFEGSAVFGKNSKAVARR